MLRSVAIDMDTTNRSVEPHELVETQKIKFYFVICLRPSTSSCSSTNQSLHSKKKQSRNNKLHYIIHCRYFPVLRAEHE